VGWNVQCIVQQCINFDFATSEKQVQGDFVKLLTQFRRNLHQHTHRVLLKRTHGLFEGFGNRSCLVEFFPQMAPECVQPVSANADPKGPYTGSWVKTHVVAATPKTRVDSKIQRIKIADKAQQAARLVGSTPNDSAVPWVGDNWAHHDGYRMVPTQSLDDFLCGQHFGHAQYMGDRLRSRVDFDSRRI
jgi:hypothetical protein